MLSRASLRHCFVCFFLIDLSNKSYGFSALFPLRENLRVSGGGLRVFREILRERGGLGYG